MSGSDDSKRLAAEKWFGYGRWSADYWFIGMEPGGIEGDANYDSWLRLGGDELIDCKKHHLDCGCGKWHEGPRPRTQSTWRRLIQVMLEFEGRPTHLDFVRSIQMDSFGGIQSNTALIELSALHARSLKEKVDRNLHLPARIERISQQMNQHNPKFALFYGLVNRPSYEQVTGVPFGTDSTCWRGNTLCVLAHGPTARGYSGPEYWIGLGRRMKEQVRLRGSAL